MLKGRRTHKSTQTILRAYCPLSWYWTSILTSSLCLCCHIKHCISNSFFSFTFGNIFPFNDRKDISTQMHLSLFRFMILGSKLGKWRQIFRTRTPASWLFPLMYQQCLFITLWSAQKGNEWLSCCVAVHGDVSDRLHGFNYLLNEATAMSWSWECLYSGDMRAFVI